MKTRLQPLKNRKKQEDMLEGSVREQPTSLVERLKCKFKIRRLVQLEGHNHSKIDTRGEGNPKRATLVYTLIFEP
jgi:hypothetical protein